MDVEYTGHWYYPTVYLLAFSSILSGLISKTGKSGCIFLSSYTFRYPSPLSALDSQSAPSKNKPCTNAHSSSNLASS